MMTTHSSIRFALLVIVYCLTGVVFLCRGQDPAGAVGGKGWKRYDLSLGSFSVLLPGKPVESHVSSTMTMPVEHYSYSVMAEDAIFITMRALIPEAAERWSASADSAYYKGFWDSFAAGIDKQMEAAKSPDKTKLLERRKASLSGYVGQEFVFTVGALQGRVLVTRIGRHSFVAGLLRPETTPATDGEKFFRSFTISATWLSEQKKAN